MTEYFVTINRYLFIARYSPYPTKAPARLDHDLWRHPAGTPISLRDEDKGQRIRRSTIPVYTPQTISDLLSHWGHPTKPTEGIGLMGDGTGRWIGRIDLATEAEIAYGLDLDTQLGDEA